MAGHDLPRLRSHNGLVRAAKAGEQVRFLGTVAACGDGFNGRYRNRWLHIQTSVGLIQVTAAMNSPLGTATVGTAIHLVARLTGLLDLTCDLYFAEHAKVLSLASAVTGPPR